MNQIGQLLRRLGPSNFFRNFSSQKASIFSDRYELSQAEVDKILKRKPKKPSESAQPATSSQTTADQEKEQLQQLFNKKPNYEIPDRFIADLEPIKPRTSNQTITKVEEKEEKFPAECQTKYGLPIKNIEIPVEQDLELERDKQPLETTNMRVMNMLQITGDTPYEIYELELQKKLSSEMDMYGSVVDENELMEQQINTLQENLIPLTHLQSENYMSHVRKCFTLNISMPGTLENEHPHKFLRNLRPIEEFRHTPLIPISDKLMQAHKERVEKYHRAGVYFEVKKETLFNLGVFGVALVLMYMLLKFVSGKEEEAAIAYQRLRIQRLREY